MESPEINVGLSKKIKTNANKFIQGNEWNYVPFPNIAPFNEWYPGFMRGEYVCITGGTSSSKTQFTKNIFMFTAIEWAIKNNIDYKVIWFGLEESVEEARYSLYSWLLYKASGGSIRYNIEDFECVGKSVNPEHFEILEKVDALFEKFWSYVHFFDMVDNSYGIYIETKRIAVKRGTFYNLKKALTAEEVLGGEKWTDYKPHNPLEYVAVVVDHIGLMEPQKDEKDLAAAMKKCSKNMRFYITKKFNYIGVVVQQQMLEMENLEHIRESQVYASLQGLGDSKVLSRDYKTVLGITNINRYGLKMANTSVGNVPVSELGDYQRVISILKRRFGKTNRRCVTFTDGCVGHFATLPKPKSEDFNLLTQKIKEYEKLREV